MTTPRNRQTVAIVVAVAGLIGIALFVFWPWSPPPPPPHNGSLQTKIDEALTRQKDGKWADAVKAWEELEKEPGLTAEQQRTVQESLDTARAQSETAAERERILALQREGKWKEAAEAWQQLAGAEHLTTEQQGSIAQNQSIASGMASQPLETKWERPKDEKGNPMLGEGEQPPEPIEEEHFLSYYPKDRKIRSLAVFNVSGSGTNSLLVAKGTVHFASQLRIVAETTVRENNGNRAVFEVHFREATQEMAVSEIDSIVLDIPEGGLLELAWKSLEKYVLEEFPLYRKVRWAIGIMGPADPNLEGLFTTLVRQLKDSTGIDVTGSTSPLELFRRVEDLQGQKVQIEYVRDLGVTKIDVLDGKRLPRETLEDIAYRSSLLMDYYLFPAAAKPVGAQWTIPVKDVVGTVGAGYRATASGDLIVAREENFERNGEQLARLVLKPGKPIDLEFDEDPDKVTVSLSVTNERTAPEIDYSIRDKLIRRARVDWQFSAKTIPEYFLFSGTQLTKASCQSYYEAETVPASSTAGTLSKTPSQKSDPTQP